MNGRIVIVTVLPLGLQLYQVYVIPPSLGSSSFSSGLEKCSGWKPRDTRKSTAARYLLRFFNGKFQVK